MIETLAAIDAPHFYAGIVLQDGRVVEAANIVKYMRRWSRDRVRAYCKAKGWTVTVVWQMERADGRQPGKSDQGSGAHRAVDEADGGRS